MTSAMTHRARALLLVLAAACAAACTKDPPKPGASTGSTASASSSPSPAGSRPRSGKIPDLRAAPRPTAPRARSLPPEVNPPGAPTLTGKLEEDRGVRYIDERVGTGKPPVSGKRVTVHYTGWLPDGTKFDSSRDRDEPIQFNFDTAMVIKGWDIGLASMRAGGKRRIIIPAELGYGDRGAGDAIPPGAMLVFDVELIEVGD